MRLYKNLVIGTSLLLLAACGTPAPGVDSDYRGEIEQWRANRLERLQAEDGWLAVVGLHWLRDGVNRVGSKPDNEVVLDAPGVPPLAGTIELLEDGTVVARATAEGKVVINGEPLTESALATDATGRPDMLGLGRLSFYVIGRGGKLAVRVKDPGSKARQQFEGIKYFPIDRRYKVVATLEAYDELKKVQVSNITGDATTRLAPGLLHFSLDGELLSLEPYVDSPDDHSYFLMFRDRTSGGTTYGTGRFLRATSVGNDGTTEIDFNYAYNPPCAFTAFATCPLPPQQNSLPIPVAAGEKFSGH